MTAWPSGDRRALSRLSAGQAERDLARRKWTMLGVIAASSALAGPVLAEPLIIDETALDDARLAPGIYPSAPMPEGFEVPAESAHPPVEIDWSTFAATRLMSRTA